MSKPLCQNNCCNTRCNRCKDKILIQSKSRKYDPKIHHIFCDCCIQNIKVCSRSKCRQIFLLKDNDFKRLKHLYISNKNNKYCFYIWGEIEQFVINKYGSLEHLNQLLKDTHRF